MSTARNPDRPVRASQLALADPATVLVVGGGPAGAFFAISILRRARALGRQIDVVILEKKRELHFYAGASVQPCREGCNQCAGAISPRLADVLHRLELALPEEIIAGQVSMLAVHGDWKTIELPVPEGRTMLSVFRGTRPRTRSDRHVNFDGFLLDRAIQEGARVIQGDAYDIRRSSAGKPVIHYRSAQDPAARLEADFAVFAAGVNQMSGARQESAPLIRALGDALPRFRPAKVRRTLICELLADEASARALEGETHFVQYGSREVKIEMSFVMPKGRHITVVLIGPSVDRVSPSQSTRLVDQFLALPHVRRIFPKGIQLDRVCLCTPNMTVGTARGLVGDRMAVIGDMAAARLCKDGIYSAYLTAAALAEAITAGGIDQKSLERSYLPAVRALSLDNRFGAVVFLLNRVTFSRPVLSRCLYQAIITERKTRPANQRRLARALWCIASGDDWYRAALLGMLRPGNLARIAAGGVLATARNALVERFLGLEWRGLGRYPTGAPWEHLERRRRALAERLRAGTPQRAPHFEKMHSIKIHATRSRIWDQLGRFGSEDCPYLKLRWIRVRRTEGEPHRPGCVVRYELIPRSLSFRLVLEEVMPERCLIYRVQDGFARDGVLVFDLESCARDAHRISVYVAFDFGRGAAGPRKLAWRLFRLVFPRFLHDVVWNHALCKLKEVIEEGGDEETPGGATVSPT